jgi:protein TonB
LITDGADDDGASGTMGTASSANAAFADAAAALSASGSGGPIPFGSTNSAEPTGVVFGPKPPYPPAARRAGFEGAVVLRVLVDEAGAPKVAEVRQSSGRNDCDESAKRTIENKWRFEPAPRPGVELVERQVVVRYTLQG